MSNETSQPLNSEQDLASIPTAQGGLSRIAIARLKRADVPVVDKVAGCEGRLGLKKPVQNLIMETPPVLCTFGWRVAEPSLAWSEAVGPRLIHQPGPDQRLFHFDDVMIHPYAVLGFLVFCAAAAWTMALIV
jgi:hypothetical protein